MPKELWSGHVKVTEDRPGQRTLHLKHDGEVEFTSVKLKGRLTRALPFEAVIDCVKQEKARKAKNVK